MASFSFWLLAIMQKPDVDIPPDAIMEESHFEIPPDGILYFEDGEELDDEDFDSASDDNE
jgi:hypothetical protein